ncbi:hypothetical protein [Streptomyces hainanensis]|uniref:Transposase n=1 Tax=Streptomyces hainanensis TaxID=402648 RepID=A0A4R4TK56_9ACTN|nr:hypothetical protein [Streptomyces hainanensis]TDC75692.1 hypothetical protein E1283_11665 [Streptomyces hainanensis]
MNYRCTTFTKIKDDYERAIRREADSAVLRPGTRRSQVLETNAKVIRRRMAVALNQHMRRCRLCG